MEHGHDSSSMDNNEITRTLVEAEGNAACTGPFANLRGVLRRGGGGVCLPWRRETFK